VRVLSASDWVGLGLGLGLGKGLLDFDYHIGGEDHSGLSDLADESDGRCTRQGTAEGPVLPPVDSQIRKKGLPLDGQIRKKSLGTRARLLRGGTRLGLGSLGSPASV
jgi:hypothetical protein